MDVTTSYFNPVQHLCQPQNAIRDLFRVIWQAVTTSDHNVYGMGSPVTRGLEQLFRDPNARRLLTQGLLGFILNVSPPLVSSPAASANP